MTSAVSLEPSIHMYVCTFGEVCDFASSPKTKSVTALGSVLARQLNLVPGYLVTCNLSPTRRIDNMFVAHLCVRNVRASVFAFQHTATRTLGVFCYIWQVSASV